MVGHVAHLIHVFILPPQIFIWCLRYHLVHDSLSSIKRIGPVPARSRQSPCAGHRATGSKCVWLILIEIPWRTDIFDRLTAPASTSTPR